MMEPVERVADYVRALDIHVDAPVMLRSTNNAVAWLATSDVVAKVAGAGGRLAHELTVSQFLASIDAPIVAPHVKLGDRVHTVAGRDVTFWTYVPQRNLSIGSCRFLRCLDGWSVDPGLGRDLGGCGSGGESFGVGGVGGVKGGLTVLENHGVVAGMEVGGPQVADAGVVVNLVVPGEEAAAPGVRASPIEANRSG